MSSALAPALELRPQAGNQERWLASPADIAIGGGGAGGGKTFGLELEPCRHLDVPGFNACIFRRTMPEITNPGGLWDESYNIYPLLGGEDYASGREWYWAKSRASVKFGGIEYESDKTKWQGAQICLLCFDQLEHFPEDVFFYMLSRNRSSCGVRPYVRATCNPDPDSWLAEFLSFWIDQDSGFPIKERSGRLRWFLRINDEIHWEDSAAACLAHARALGMHEALDAEGRAVPILPKSVTFVPMSIYDNPKLMAADPGYMANLLALNYVDRMRLLEQNWKVRPSAGSFFNRAWFKIVDAAPAQAKRVRYWDKAGSKETGDPKQAQTSGVLMAQAGEGKSRQWYVEDCISGLWPALEREQVILSTARMDNPKGQESRCPIWSEQEPGSGGKESAESTIRALAGFVAFADRVTGDKFERARPLAAQAAAGNVHLVRGAWNAAFLAQLHNANPEIKKQRLDSMDAAAGAFNKLCAGGQGLRII